MTDVPPKPKRTTAATIRSTGGAGLAFADFVVADLLSQMLLDLPIDGIGVAGDHVLLAGRDAHPPSRTAAPHTPAHPR